MERVSALEDLEVELLLEAVYRHLGLDFRDYDRAPLKQRLFKLMQAESVSTVSAMQDRVLHDAHTSQALLQALASASATLFANPSHLHVIREQVLTHLKSYPAPKIWIAECNNAQTAWTIAILLEEVQLYDKTLIYTTSTSAGAARMGWQTTVPAAYVSKCESNYRDSGGTAYLADYFDTQADQMALHPRLRKNLVWAQHNLATDASFNEFQFILCRNLRPDFDPLLRGSALRLFHESLPRFGMLSIDWITATELAQLADSYQSLSAEHGLFKRTGG